MHTGKELGDALREAMRLKNVKQKQLALEFGVAQPSVSEWLSLGRISKSHIPKLLYYFKDQVGPDHWGLPFTKEEFDLLYNYRLLHDEARARVRELVTDAAQKQIAARAAADALLQRDLAAGEPGEIIRKQRWA